MRKGSICKIISKGVDVMSITISGKNIEITEGLKHAINEKLGKLERTGRARKCMSIPGREWLFQKKLRRC